MPETRYEPRIRYQGPFLVWWGLLLFLCKLGRLRQLDSELRDEQTEVLANVNALAETQQTTLPVSGTLRHYLVHLGPAPRATLRTRMIRTLIRGKVLDAYRLQGAFVIAVDGTGHLSFARRHCDHCLTQTHGERTYYYHQVLEAKLVTGSGLALSVASEFIDNRHLSQATAASAEARKQDCELKAFARLAVELKKQYPQTPLCIAGDALHACGPVLQICEDNHWHFVLTFKEGRLPAVWQEFQTLLAACPVQVHVVQPQEGLTVEYRWVNDMSYEDDQQRHHTFHAVQCQVRQGESRQFFAWITDWRLTPQNLEGITQQGGRQRWTIENAGFNTQKNGGYELEHVYGRDENLLKSYYLLLQIAHLMWQLVEHGSLLQRVAREYGQSLLGLYGSIRNLARRLLECLRFYRLGAEAFAAARLQIRLDSS
ncbi:MAG: hypothetical protein FJ288_19435 [Planctomycetes bacterium]|nr:hypothetical protein [Planctomycetota bacterium]